MSPAQIRWTEAEKVKMAIRHLLVKAQLGETSFTRSFGEAQLVLPEDRRRPVTGRHIAPWLPGLEAQVGRDASVKEAITKAGALPSVPSAIPGLSEKLDQDTPEELSEDHVILQMVAKQVQPAKLSDEDVDRIASVVVAKMEPLLRSLLAPASVSVPHALPAIPKHNPAPIVQTRDGRKHSVLIIGAMPDQEMILKREFGDVIRCVKEPTTKALGDLVKSSKHVVLWEGKIPAHDGRVVQAYLPPGCRAEKAKGISGIKESVRRYLSAH